MHKKVKILYITPINALWS